MSLTTRSDRWAVGAVVLLTFLAVCALALPSGEGVAAPAAPPTNTAEPTISGRAEQGRTLSATPGSWSGTGPISFSYRWVRCNSAGGDCLSISGGSSRNYRVSSGDVGHKLRFNVTARNSLGSSTVISTESAIVTEPLPSGAIRLPSGAPSRRGPGVGGREQPRPAAGARKVHP